MTIPKNSVAEFEQALVDRLNQIYVLRLYVTGVSPSSIQAITNIKQLCEQHLAGRYELEVIDLFQQPEQAAQEQIVVVPTLIKLLPLPLRRLIGNLSDTKHILERLDLPTAQNIHQSTHGGEDGSGSAGAPHFATPI